MQVAILQSNYIPWKGYFDIIDSADVAVIFDTRQYTKNDWRNRNQILVTGRPTWLTIPVRVSGRFGQSIRETEVADARWSKKHWKAISQAYSSSPFFDLFADSWAQAWSLAGESRLLSEINHLLIDEMIKGLGSTTKLIRDTDLTCVRDSDMSGALDPSSLVLQMCIELGATSYITGPAGLSYLNRGAFTENGVRVVVADYSTYRDYPQASTEMFHRVSIVDLLANTGEGARDFLVGARW